MLHFYGFIVSAIILSFNIWSKNIRTLEIKIYDIIKLYVNITNFNTNVDFHVTISICIT